jgi:hypothetical protein
MFRNLLIASAALVAIAIGILWFACPCAIVPGGSLSGEQTSTAVDDWSFANSQPLCQVEVEAVIPYSVNVNCMSADGALYVSCSHCEGKFWSSKAVAIPAGRIRIGTNVYPARFNRLVEDDELDTAWRARASKLGLGEDVGRPNHWWSFELTSR